MDNFFLETLAKSPIIAILRHLSPQNAVAVGEALVEAGVLIIEVPLNGKEALASLDLLSKALRSKAIIGAGTVVNPQDVSKASACGARFLLSPNMDADVMSATRRLGLISIPGVATPTEAFAALKHGAKALKIFPGDMISPKVIHAFRTVLPADVAMIISGGVNVDNIRTYREAGAKGFGVASAIFSPSMAPKDVCARAKDLLAALIAEGVSNAND